MIDIPSIRRSSQSCKSKSGVNLRLFRLEGILCIDHFTLSSVACRRLQVRTNGSQGWYPETQWGTGKTKRYHVISFHKENAPTSVYRWDSEIPEQSHWASGDGALLS